MKFLPWVLLSALLVSSVVFGQTAVGTNVQKILGVPAASEWLDLESGANGQPGVQFSVPPGRVLTMVYKGTSPENTGSLIGTIDVDGTVVFKISLSAGKLIALHITGAEPWMNGITASAGQVVTVTRTGGAAPASEVFFVRGWLEPVS